MILFLDSWGEPIENAGPEEARVGAREKGRNSEQREGRWRGGCAEVAITSCSVLG